MALWSYKVVVILLSLLILLCESINNLSLDILSDQIAPNLQLKPLLRLGQSNKKINKALTKETQKLIEQAGMLC